MTSLYEGMFLLDNQVVRQDWSKAKSVVTDLLEKHGASVKSARRWDERRLAYPIKRRNRATFLLTYCEIPSEGIAPLRRDLELSEDILRYLFLTSSEVPQEELDLSSSETSDDFVVPLPPEDHELDPEEKPEDKDGENSEAKSEEKTEPKAEGDAPAAEAGEKVAEEAAAEAPAEAAATPETTEEASTPDPEKKEEA